MNEQTVIIKPILEIKRAIMCLSDRDCRECKYLRICKRNVYRLKLGYTVDNFGNWYPPFKKAKRGVDDMNESKHLHLKIRVINNVKSLKQAMACTTPLDCNRCGCRDRCLKLAIKGGWRDSSLKNHSPLFTEDKSKPQRKGD